MIYFEKVSQKENLDKGYQPTRFGFSKDVLSATDIALFIPATDNLCLVIDHKRHLAALQNQLSEVPAKEIWDALFGLLDNTVDTAYYFYLWEHFSLKNLSFILPGMAGSRADFGALLRIYKPADFSLKKIGIQETFKT